MLSDFAVNKYLHTVAPCWILLVYGVSCTIYKHNANLNRNHHHQLGTNISSRQWKGKVTLEIFYCQLIVHCEFIPGGKTMNKEVYVVILPCLRDAQNETP